MTYNLFALGQEGKFYLTSVLGRGTTFFQRLGKVSDFEKGQAFAFLPLNANKDGLYKFMTGGMVRGADQTRKALVGLLLKFLGSFSKYLVVFENRSARKGEPCLENSKSKIILFGEEVYHWADEKVGAELLLETFKDAETAIQTGFAVFSNLQEDLLPPPLEHLGKWFESLLPYCKLIGVSAYDGETYILWIKASQPGEEEKGTQLFLKAINSGEEKSCQDPF